MKTLTLLQPWAQLVVLGDKRVETRSWKTDYRGEILIHSSKRINFSDLELCRQDKHFMRCIPDPTKLITGAILGSVVIRDIFRVEEVRNDLSDQELTFGNYKDGRYAWLLSEPKVFVKPIYGVSGRLQLWDYKHRATPTPEYDEPGEPDYNAPNQYERQEMMDRYQQLK